MKSRITLNDQASENHWLIENVRWIDPQSGSDRIGRLHVVDGIICGMDTLDDDLPKELNRYDGTGLIGGPGWIDLATELGEPGREEDETLETGLRSALAGGFTSVVASANTLPAIDTPASVQFIQQKAARTALAKVYALGCVSKGRGGEELAEIGSLVEAGVVALSDAPSPINSNALLKRALEYCSMFDKVILDHPEVTSLSYGGVMHEDMTQLILGLAPMPAESEDLATSRDIRLVEATGGRLHLLGISTAGSVELCRRAKSREEPLTVGIAIANLHCIDEQLRSFDSNCKINPPMRSQMHVDACREGLADGTIDIISTGHRPCSLEKKMQELDAAPFGMVGLETAVGQVVTHVVQPGLLDWIGVFQKMSSRPASLLKIPGGSLAIGQPADLVLINPIERWTVDAPRMMTKAYNTPLHRTELTGRAVATFVNGMLKFQSA